MSTTLPHIPQNHEIENRSSDEQWLDGFLTFCECDAAQDYSSPGELLALTKYELMGYNSAIQAKDFSEHQAFRTMTNAWGDSTDF